MEGLWILGFVVAWILLQAWILPRLGVRTCLAPGCGLDRAEAPVARERAEEPGVSEGAGEAR